MDEDIWSRTVEEWLDGLPLPQRGYAWLRWRKVESRMPMLVAAASRDLKERGMAEMLCAFHARLVLNGLMPDEATHLLVRVLKEAA